MLITDNKEGFTFAPDEFFVESVDRRWRPDYLLSLDGVFYLKDISRTLDIDVRKLIRKVNVLKESGQSPWEVMGLGKHWRHWVVRMKVFAVYYEEHLRPRVQKVCYEWDCNTMLGKKGLFMLTEVCRNLPFTAHQIMYQAKKNPHAAVQWGIWKDENLNRYLVRMEVFSMWIMDLWKNRVKHEV